MILKKKRKKNESQAYGMKLMMLKAAIHIKSKKTILIFTKQRI